MPQKYFAKAFDDNGVGIIIDVSEIKKVRQSIKTMLAERFNMKTKQRTNNTDIVHDKMTLFRGISVISGPKKVVHL